ncbi:MAG: hypothetical protein CL846_01810 [Crocinitomicaceae bacterium]|nr:hypothetical protein [Crocinitomicaceae bacterium]|tara:strand:- start:589 stop:1065 length:477 start_codon:yes stop_codon:yes gene_type:complete
MDKKENEKNSNLLKVFRFYINMRKTTFIIYTLLFFSLTLNAQIKVDSRILDVYGEEYVNEVLANIPNRIQHLNYYLNNSYEIKKLDVIESKKIPLISKYLRVLKHKEKNNYVPDLNNFNILMYDAPRDKNFKKFYRLDNTDYVIVFYSIEEFLRKRNN